MNEVILNFHQCLQNTQILGSENEHLVSILYFRIENREFQCVISQPEGEAFAYDDSPIVAEMPEELVGILMYDSFQEAAENYYRSLIGPNGRAMRIIGGTNIVMRNNTIRIPASYSVQLIEGTSPAWST